jgi:hypothetical protein
MQVSNVVTQNKVYRLARLARLMARFQLASNAKECWKALNHGGWQKLVKDALTDKAICWWVREGT